MSVIHRLHCVIIHVWYYVIQVEEAVAVLQAHQAKKDATQKVGSMAPTAAAATSWRLRAVLKRYDNTQSVKLFILWSYKM